MISSVFRYGAGQEVPVNPALTAPGVDPGDQARLLRRLLDEVSTAAATDHSCFVWIRVNNPTETDLALIGDLLALPQLQLDDAMNDRQRAKIELLDEGAFAVLKELRYRDETSDVETGQIAIFLGRGYAVSVRHGEATPGSSRRRLADHREITAQGPASVLYAIADVLADGYLDIVEHLADDLEDLEERVFSMRGAQDVSLVYNLKRENLEVKRAILPLITQARMLVNEMHPEVPPGLAAYFRDVGDHVLRANDLVESHDQLLMAMLMAATSQQDLQQNRDMRKISAWAAIIAVPTAIAGIYGMNFEDMPELHWAWGYPAVLVIMATACTFLYRRFKRSGWL